VEVREIGGGLPSITIAFLSNTWSLNGRKKKVEKRRTSGVDPSMRRVGGHGRRSAKPPIFQQQSKVNEQTYAKGCEKRGSLRKFT